MKGFTLLEVVVVVGIIALISSTMLVYNRSAENQIALYRDQALVVGALNRTKALAIEKYNSPGACGYGVHVSEYSRSFFIFEDRYDETIGKCLDAGVYTGDFAYTAGEQFGETIFLSPQSRFRLSETTGGGAQQEVGWLDIVFVPPDPAVYSGNSFPLEIAIGEGDVRVGPEAPYPAPPIVTGVSEVGVIISSRGQVSRD